MKDKAIDRNRALLAWAFGYEKKLDLSNLNFGLHVDISQPKADLSKPYAIFLHGTNWQSKVLPLQHWIDLANQFNQQGLEIYLPWSNDEEYDRARCIAGVTNAQLVIIKYKYWYQC